MTPREIPGKKFSILAHGTGTGNAEELRDWLLSKKAREVVYITFPFGPSPQKEIRTEVFRAGRLVRTVKSLVRFGKPSFLSYLKDFLYALFYIPRFCRDSDVTVAGDNLLAAAALASRKRARLGRIVYYMIDYTPVRYGFKPLNELYYALDRYAAEGADCVWPLDERTIGGRFDHGRLDPERVTWYAVPYGNHSARIRLPKSVKASRIVYMGGLLKSKGAELFIPIAEGLARRGVNFEFVIVGGGPYRAELEAEAVRRGLGKKIRVLGYVDDFNEVMDLLKNCGVALAPYYPEDRNNFSYYADAGKLKSYLGCGLPIVVTDVPPFAKVLAKKGAGLIAKYDASDFAEKIARIIRRQSAFRKKAAALGREFDWDRVLTRAFSRLP